MPDLPETLRLVYDAAGPHPRNVPLADVYLDARFQAGMGDRPFLYVNMVQTFDGQAVLQGSAYTIGTDVDHFLLRQLRVHADAVLYGAGVLPLLVLPALFALSFDQAAFSTRSLQRLHALRGEGTGSDHAPGAADAGRDP